MHLPLPSLLVGFNGLRTLPVDAKYDRASIVEITSSQHIELFATDYRIKNDMLRVYGAR
jgi:hypothetical protein